MNDLYRNTLTFRVPGAVQPRLIIPDMLVLLLQQLESRPFRFGDHVPEPRDSDADWRAVNWGCATESQSAIPPIISGSKGAIVQQFISLGQTPHAVAVEMSRLRPMLIVTLSYSCAEAGVVGSITLQGGRVTHDYDQSWCWAANLDDYAQRDDRTSPAQRRAWPEPAVLRVS